MRDKSSRSFYPQDVYRLLERAEHQGHIAVKILPSKLRAVIRVAAEAGLIDIGINHPFCGTQFNANAALLRHVYQGSDLIIRASQSGKTALQNYNLSLLRTSHQSKRVNKTLEKKPGLLAKTRQALSAPNSSGAHDSRTLPKLRNPRKTGSDSWIETAREHPFSNKKTDAFEKEEEQLHPASHNNEQQHKNRSRILELQNAIDGNAAKIRKPAQDKPNSITPSSQSVQQNQVTLSPHRAAEKDVPIYADLRKAIAEKGKDEKPDTICRTAKVSSQKGRQILRVLQESGEYTGFCKPAPRRRQ